MTNHSIRISRESDLILDNLKLKIRTKYHKKIYKGKILDWCIQHCLTLKGAEKKFEDFVKKNY